LSAKAITRSEPETGNGNGGVPSTEQGDVTPPKLPPATDLSMVAPLPPPVSLPAGGKALPQSKLLGDASFEAAARRASKGSGSVVVAVGDRGYIPMLVN